MTEYTLTHPLWMWIYFGAFGSIGAILLTLIIWRLAKLHALAQGGQRRAARCSMVGCLFLFSAAWFACGIGGTPGNLLSSDLAAHNSAGANNVAALSILLSVPGWVCLPVAHWRLARSPRFESTAGS